jgi:hypothetical protein
MDDAKAQGTWANLGAPATHYVRGGGDARMVVEYARIGVWHGPWHVAGEHDSRSLVSARVGFVGALIYHCTVSDPRFVALATSASSILNITIASGSMSEQVVST